MSKQILALDPATKCGWAHSCGCSGVWDLSVRPDESAGMRLIRLRGKLREIKEQVGVDLLVFEASRNLRYGTPVRVAAQLQAVIEVWCTDEGIEYCPYSATAIKKFAVGTGKANKTAMVEAAKTKWADTQIIDDNHADALWLLSLATHEYGADI